MHLRDTDNWLSNTTRPIGANYAPTNTWARTRADAITSQVGGRYRHVGRILSLEWTSRCLGLGVQNWILEVWRTPLILNFGVRQRFQDVIYAVHRLNRSPEASSFIFYRIFIKLAGNQDRHKISDEFEFWPDLISHFEVTCPCGWIKFSIEIWNLQVQLTFQTLECFVTLFLGTVRPRRLKLGTHMGKGQMYHVYWNQAAAAYSFLYFFIFVSLRFSTLKCFVTLFLRTVRPRRLKLGTHVDSGQMYHAYQNQAAAAYSSLYFFIFLSLQFSTLKFFITLFSGRRLQIGTHMDNGQMFHVYQNQVAAAYSSFYFSIFLSLKFSTLKFFITLFSVTVRPRTLKIGTHVDSGQIIIYTGIRLLLLIHPLFLHFLSLQFSNIKIFCHTYIRNCEA